MRECDEHAIWPRGSTGQGTGDPRRTRRDLLEACSPNANRKPCRCDIRSSSRCAPGLLGGRYAGAGVQRLAVSIAILDSIYDRRARARVHSRHHAGCDNRFRSGSGVDQRSPQRRRDDEGRRPRQQQPASQPYHACACHRTNRVDRCAFDRGDARNEIDSESAQARLRLR